MDKLTEFFLARHGQTEWNLLRRIQGQTNTRLSFLGIKQGQDLMLALQGQPISQIYTSSLERAIETARPLASLLKIPIHSTDLLNEMAFGVMEGKCFSTFSPEDRELWGWWQENPVERRIPGGENYLDLYQRAALFLKDLNPTGEKRTILIVGHLRINQMLLGHWLDLPPEKAAFIQQANNWLYRFLEDSKIMGAAIPTRKGEEFHWQTGLILAD